MAIIWTPHPLEPAPSDAQILAAQTDEQKELLAKWHSAREERIRLATQDPLNHGYEFPSWPLTIDLFDKYGEVFAFGGNGSSKSMLGAYLVVDALIKNPGARIYCFAQDDDASTQIQQRYVYNYLPPKYKEKRMSSTGYMKYSLKNGFTDNSFILDVGDGTEPRECHFFKYSQYQANKAKFEGYEYGSRDAKTINIGAWLDEYLENGELYDTLLYRIPRRGASIFTTFTPIDHMTPFVADKIKGSQVTKRVKTNPRVFKGKDDPKEVEWVREKTYSDEEKSGVGMVFMPSEDNPWAGFNNMVSLHSHKSLEERLVRFHGIPSNVITSLFPKFSTNVNVIQKNPVFDKKRYTCYMVADPAGRRSYSCIWALVDKDGYVTVLKEFPERRIYGEWARFGSPRWTYGPGSKKVYMSVASYVEEWRKIEEELGVEVSERIGDKRAFASENDNSIDRFEAFGELDMHFVPSGGKPQGDKGEEETGLQFLDEWFDYDETSPVDEVNRPLLQIHESCENLIDSILNYNANGKSDEALKDFIDLLRYLRMANGGIGPEHYTDMDLEHIPACGGY